MTRRLKRSRRSKGPAGDYTVGYRRAPVSKRWKPGQSGNPQGRKKASKTVGKIIEDNLLRKVTFKENGRRITLTIQEKIIRHLSNAAATGDMNAIRNLFALKDRYQGSKETVLDPAELLPEDQAIIDDYLKKRQLSAGAGSSAEDEKRSEVKEESSGAANSNPTLPDEASK
jgi:hypothetical protein